MGKLIELRRQNLSIDIDDAPASFSFGGARAFCGRPRRTPLFGGDSFVGAA
jgi:hypothetical protein